MLANRDAAATIAVKNLAKAKTFYEGKLGFKRFGPDGPAITYKSGNSVIVVYESEYAGTNKATSATWAVGDELDDIVRTLNDSGVPFEHYDMPGGSRDGDIHIFGDFRAAWFKDPDGNILHINSA